MKKISALFLAMMLRKLGLYFQETITSRSIILKRKVLFKSFAHLKEHIIIKRSFSYLKENN